MTAVADDDPFREARIVSLLADPVDIDAGREQVSTCGTSAIVLTSPQ
jgi:hypothetical protein